MSYVNLGAVSAGHKLPPEVLQKVVESLIINKAAADKEADRLADTQPILTRSAMREWASNFKKNLEEMVVQAITVTKSGFYPWETRPQILDAIADYIDSSLKDMKLASKELTGISEGFRQSARLLAQVGAEGAAVSFEALLEAVNKSIEEAQKKPLATAVAVGGALAVLFLLWKLK